MIKSELLKECVADAKAIQATALANARAALEEAFSPKLKEMLSTKLSEEASLEDEAPVSEVPQEETVTEKEVDEMLAELENEGGEQPAPVVPPTAPAPEAAPAPVAPAPEPTPATDVPAEENAEEEINIDELLESLKKDDKEEEEEEEEESKELDETVGDKEPAGQKSMPGTSAKGKFKTSGIGSKKQEFGATLEESAEEEEEVNLEELISSLDETVGDVEPAGEKGSQNPKKGFPVVKGNKPAKVYESAEEDCKCKECSKLKEELTEHKEACEYMRTQLSEVNLLNAKLLYTNRLFKSNALNNSQKMKIIEAFDLAKSIREVKLTYAAMNEAINLGSGVQNKGTVITEGLASKSIGTTKPANEKVVISEVNEMASRFQKLAGIKK